MEEDRPGEDSVLRAMTNDGGFRVITTSTTHLADEVVRLQGSVGKSSAHLADLLTGAVLVRETMAPKLRVQAVLQGAGGSGNIVADSDPDGGVRGLVRARREGGEVLLGNGALLQVMRTLPDGRMHQGVVEAGETIAEALMVYMQESEQVVSMISVGCQIESNRVVAAAGYLVQLLPELAEGPLMLMTERLKDFRSIAHLLTTTAASPAQLMDELLYGMDYTLLEQSPLRFACRCDRVRVMTTLASLPPEDIAELMAAGTAIDMTCDYCGQNYHVEVESLRGLLAET